MLFPAFLHSTSKIMDEVFEMYIHTVFMYCLKNEQCVLSGFYT